MNFWGGRDQIGNITRTFWFHFLVILHMENRKFSNCFINLICFVAATFIFVLLPPHLFREGVNREKLTVKKLIDKEMFFFSPFMSLTNREKSA